MDQRGQGGMLLARPTEHGDGVAPRVDDLDRSGRRRHVLVWVGALCALLLVTIPVAAGIGPVAIAPGTAARIVGHHLVD